VETESKLRMGRAFPGTGLQATST